MKAIFKKTGQNVSTYNRSTNGNEFIDTCNTVEEFQEKINSLEAMYIYEQEDGTILDDSGNEVFDPKYPNRFDFTDYIYTFVEIESIDEYNDADLIRAIKNENPYNLDEILELI